MQRTVRPAWIAGLWAAVVLLATGCAGTPAPRPSVEDAGVSEAAVVPHPGGDDHRRPPVPRRVERTRQRRADPEPPGDEPGTRPDEPAPPGDGPTSPPGGGSRTPSPDRGTPSGDGRPALPREGRDPPDGRDGPIPRPDGATCPEPDVVTEQADLVHAAATRPLPAVPGFAGLELSAADCRIDLWWNGPVPPTVLAAVEPIDRAGGVHDVHAVHVVTHEAAYSAADVDRGADALTAERLVTLPGRAPVTVAVEAVIPRHDGAGIGVEISVEAGPAEPRLAEPGLAERVAASLTDRAGVPVFVEVVAHPPVALGVVDEPNPNPNTSSSGERSYHPVPGRPGTFAACTIGFAVRAGAGEGHWLLTADHCTGGADGPAFDGADVPIGAVTEHRPALDSTRIAVPDEHDEDDDRALVRGAAANYPGKSVCHAGATSGEVCDLVIRQVDRRQWSEALGTYVQELVQAEHARGLRAARPGDSGGPVYRTSAAGEVDAQGILVMGHTGDLLGSPVDTIYYVDIRALLAEWGADLELDRGPRPTVA